MRSTPLRHLRSSSGSARRCEAARMRCITYALIVVDHRVRYVAKAVPEAGDNWRESTRAVGEGAAKPHSGLWMSRRQGTKSHSCRCDRPYRSSGRAAQNQSMRHRRNNLLQPAADPRQPADPRSRWGWRPTGLKHTPKGKCQSPTPVDHTNSLVNRG
jgi:hypothetical protein